ncbi:MAG: hypothetical protein HY688_00050 [Chloroflexi bacterium]|nr:hypothetical protein [Chloroflexota bacterium]
MPDTLSVRLDLTAEEYGALLAAAAQAAALARPGLERALLEAVDDKLRAAQRQVLGPMSVGEGMRLERSIQASERAVAAALSKG